MGIVTVQKTPVAGLVKEDVAFKSTVMAETSASELDLIANYLVAAVKVSQEGLAMTTPFFL